MIVCRRPTSRLADRQRRRSTCATPDHVDPLQLALGEETNRPGCRGDQNGTRRIFGAVQRRRRRPSVARSHNSGISRHAFATNTSHFPSGESANCGARQRRMRAAKMPMRRRSDIEAQNRERFELECATGCEGPPARAAALRQPTAPRRQSAHRDLRPACTWSRCVVAC